MDALVEIEPKDWPIWQELLKKDWPRGIPGFYLIKMQAYWRENNLPDPMKFYAPYGDLNAGLVAFNYKHYTKETIVIAINKKTDILEKALLETKLIDWNSGMKIPYAAKEIVDMVKERIFPNITGCTMKVSPCFAFYRSRDRPRIEMKIPEGLSLQPLTTEYSKIANDTFPHKYPGSEYHFENLIKAGLGFGLFKNGELVCMGFKNENGFNNHLLTLEKHRRNQYAEVFAHLMGERDRQRHNDTYSYVVVDNLQSIKLHIKLGADVYGINSWIFLEPKVVESKL